MYTLPNQCVNNIDIKEFTFKKLLLATSAWVVTLDIFYGILITTS